MIIARIDSDEDVLLDFEVIKNNASLMARLKELAKDYDDNDNKVTVCVVEGEIKQFNFSRSIKMGDTEFGLGKLAPIQQLTSEYILKHLT